jgi:hypothetical protein
VEGTSFDRAIPVIEIQKQKLSRGTLIAEAHGYKESGIVFRKALAGRQRLRLLLS